MTLCQASILVSYILLLLRLLIRETAPKKPAAAKLAEKKGSSAKLAAKLTTKLEKKESAAKLAATSKMLLEYGQPVFIPDKIPFCLSCEQRFGEPDKDSATGEILKWRVFEKELSTTLSTKPQQRMSASLAGRADAGTIKAARRQTFWSRTRQRRRT